MSTNYWRRLLRGPAYACGTRTRTGTHSALCPPRWPMFSNRIVWQSHWLLYSRQRQRRALVFAAETARLAAHTHWPTRPVLHKKFCVERPLCGARFMRGVASRMPRALATSQIFYLSLLPSKSSSASDSDSRIRGTLWNKEFSSPRSLNLPGGSFIGP